MVEGEASCQAQQGDSGDHQPHPSPRQHLLFLLGRPDPRRSERGWGSGV